MLVIICTRNPEFPFNRHMNIIFYNLLAIILHERYIARDEESCEGGYDYKTNYIIFHMKENNLVESYAFHLVGMRK